MTGAAVALYLRDAFLNSMCPFWGQSGGGGELGGSWEAK